MTTLEEIQAAKAAAIRAEMQYIQTHVEAARAVLAKPGVAALCDELKDVQAKLPPDGEDFKQIGYVINTLTSVPKNLARRCNAIELALNPPPPPQQIIVPEAAQPAPAPAE